ncbi:MAG TPA: sulfatase-like hydrolase/transferase [Tessaracoccus flavescens]|uniref:Sulfatase-like hydrolase/transferase n=1 Tax=Tessaracoccus flavescens TaxID=399497 RepID=A0A921EMS8_9ACTN|nr:sulfatase-like hydrolase/transferase [Tessaracoccus flavescens]
MSVQPAFTSRLLKPRHKWGRLLATLVPVAVMGVWLKLDRIDRFFPNAGFGETLLKVASDVAFGLAWILLWVVAAAFGRVWWRTLASYLAMPASAVVAVFTVIHHEFVKRTGNPLTWERLSYAWRERGELEGLIGSEVTPQTVWLLVLAVVSTMVLPWLIGPLITKFLKTPSRRQKRLGVGLLAALLAASVWSAPTVSAAFALAAPVQFAVSPVREAVAYPSVEPTTQPLPSREDTRLVPRAGAGERNLVVIALESQRDASTLPPTKQPVTPVLDALKASSLVPERAYTVLPHTSKAVTAIHCGVAPPLDSKNSEADAEGLPMRCLPELLAEQGYATGFFQSATEHFERRRSTVRNLGFEYFLPVNKMNTSGWRKANYFGYEDEVMLVPQRRWIEQQDQPFMLSMLTVVGHHDYNLHGRPLIDFVDNNKTFNTYLNGLHYQDQFVGKVIDMFKDLGLYDDTVFVIVGDHGEGFGEHRVFQHDNTIYEEGARVPLLIHDPQRPAGVIDGPVSQLAILPTAADLLGFDVESPTDLRPSLLSGEPQGLIPVTCFARARCAATIDGDMKVIHHFGDRRDEVYNVVEDPYERNDLATEVADEWINERVDSTLEWYVDAERRSKVFAEQQ